MNSILKAVVQAIFPILIVFSAAAHSQEICGIKKVEEYRDEAGKYSVFIEGSNIQRVSVQNAAKTLSTEKSASLVSTDLIKIDLGSTEIGHIANGLGQGCIISKVYDESRKKWIRVEMHQLVFGKPPIYQVKSFELP
jgi:hypothetical protein